MTVAHALAELAAYMDLHHVPIDGPIPNAPHEARVRAVFEGALWALSMMEDSTIGDLRDLIRLSLEPDPPPSATVVPLPGGSNWPLTSVPGVRVREFTPEELDQDVEVGFWSGEPAPEVYYSDGAGNDLIVTRHADSNAVDPSTPPAPPGWRPHADVQPMTDDEAAAVDDMPDDPNAAAQIAAAKARLDQQQRR